MNLELILNDILNRAICQKGYIQKPNSNTIAEFVSEYMNKNELNNYENKTFKKN